MGWLWRNNELKQIDTSIGARLLYTQRINQLPHIRQHFKPLAQPHQHIRLGLPQHRRNQQPKLALDIRIGRREIPPALAAIDHRAVRLPIAQFECDACEAVGGILIFVVFVLSLPFDLWLKIMLQRNILLNQFDPDPQSRRNRKLEIEPIEAPDFQEFFISLESIIVI